MKKGISAALIGFVGFGLLLLQQTVLLSGCAQISAPTGGPKDTLAPKLTNATPALKSTNVTGNKITLTFNEYVEVKDAYNNVLVSPLPKNIPIVDYKLKTVTVRLKDTLLPNTTYSINFGNAIVDINEGNALTNFTYVFSTGNKIDSLQLKGKVLLAETGKADSTLVAMLYRDAPDSAVEKRRPDYISRISGDGSFAFSSLPAGRFKLYALKDGDGSKSYNAKTEPFAFMDNDIIVSDSTAAATLYAYSEQKDTRNTKPEVAPAANDKKLRYSTTINNGLQDLLGKLVITMNKPLKAYNEGFVTITDTNYVTISSAVITTDSSRKNISVTAPWTPGGHYRLLVNSKLGEDSTGAQLTKSDTVRFVVKREEDYGKLVLRFKNLDTAKHMVLQFVQGESNVVKSFLINSPEWTDKLFVPGDYELRILYDRNKNGKWDPGNYSQKLQPEIVVPLGQKLNIRANWDNERDINL